MSPSINLTTLTAVLLVVFGSSVDAAFVTQPHHHYQQQRMNSRTSLDMVDTNVIQGAGIAVAGLAAGIGLVAFTEAQGERAKERGGGLSESMSTQLSGMLLEDVEVSSVEDVGSLASKLEEALKASGGTSDEELELSEEEKKRIAEEADDGW